MDNNDSSSRLGRGLSSMFSEVSGIKAGSAPGGSGYLRLPLADIQTPHHGRHADDALAASVKNYGVLQPVLVARTERGYELLAGSRRLDAAKKAGLADVPALVIPPDRAGALDVFLEENLTRRELSEPDRIRLRDRWVRETGRDLELAEQRIPEIQWEETGSPKPPRNQRIWVAAAGVLAVVSTILLVMVLNAKPVDRRPVVIPVEFVAPAPEPAPVAPAPEPEPVDLAWMDAFRFPGLTREIHLDRLHIIYNEPLLDGGNLSNRAGVALNQLAAIMLAGDENIRVRIVTETASAAAAARRLIDEGLAPARIALQPSYEGTTSFELFKN